MSMQWLIMAVVKMVNLPQNDSERSGEPLGKGSFSWNLWDWAVARGALQE